ncbi:Fibrous sheath-interacting protein 1 [Desmophyllum pertusum]|uniref:Fibrous sheath-interacting protein 1 n=1 Tax=Desmophyllum pertusum TaxID=174260 RepID=A0A9W9Z7H3_9CNID|nr:Fibrous sheath-interacting protein 1 [Desmophyllum pertusum]
MEIVSEGSLESISRPASCDSTRARDLQLPQQKHGKKKGFLEELPPEAVTTSLDEDIDTDDDLIISPVENDVVLEDMVERTATVNSSVEEEIDEAGDDNSEASTSDNGGHVVKHEVSQDESSAKANLDPKIQKGLERIRKLDAILADKLKKEKEIKTHRRQLEKKWREEISQLDHLREQEGHGKIDLGVGHALALGPPTDDNLPGMSSSCDSWTEQDIDDVESKSSKRTRKRKGSKHSTRTKGKEQNFVKRNIELAADAGNVIPMTEAEKKRLEELMSDETDLLMVENAYSEGLSLQAGEGFTLDSQSLASLANIDSKLQELVPQEEIDLLASQDSWKPPREFVHSSQDGSSVRDVDTIGLGERILREEKEMREMKTRLLAIEADLQTLYRETGDESEAGLSEDILARLIDVSSRTTSRSTTVSESVMSALCSARSGEDMIREEEEEEEEFYHASDT